MRPEIFLTFCAIAMGTGFISWTLAAPAPARTPRPAAPLSTPKPVPTPAVIPPPLAVKPDPSALPWDQRLLQAASLASRSESQADAQAWILSCIAEAETPHRLLELAKFADDLCLTLQCLRQITAQLAKHPLSVVERVLMAWTSQAGAEILYHALPEPLNPALSQNVLLAGWIFGSRADGLLALPPKPVPPAKRLARVAALLKNNAITTPSQGVFSRGTATQSFRRLLEQMDATDHPALVGYLSAHWAQVPHSDRIPLFTVLSRRIAATLLHDLARQAARSTASDLILQEYGRTHGRSAGSVAGFIAELATWPSETSKSILVIGYLDAHKSLTSEEARKLVEAVDDVSMKEKIFKAVPKKLE